MKRRIAVVAAMFAVGCVAVGCKDDYPVPEPTWVPQKAAGRRAPARSRGPAVRWWTRPKIAKDLGLTRKQQKEMNRIQARRLGGPIVDRVRRREVEQSFRGEIAAGNWKKAEELALALREQAASEQHRQAIAKIEVLKLLSEQQREKFFQHYSGILKRKWANPLMAKKGGARAAPKAAAGAGGEPGGGQVEPAKE